MNAVLGTSLSGTNLLMMDEQQRVEEVIRSVQAMGTPFSQLDKYTQQLIMQMKDKGSLGIKPISLKIKNGSQKLISGHNLGAEFSPSLALQ